MIHFFSSSNTVFAVQKAQELTSSDISKLCWLFGNAQLHQEKVLKDYYVGPRAAMVTPWSTNAVEITQNMDIHGIVRIETYSRVSPDFTDFDPMLSQKYAELNQDIFTISIVPEPIIEIEDIAAYNRQEGLSLSEEEVDYLNNLALKMGRKLTDSEVFGFSQVNSEHCRHKIFNGRFVIDGQEQPLSLFKLIRKTSETNPNSIVSAYKDNVAFVKGPLVQQFAPKRPDVPDFYEVKEFESVISLKAETHNFPTTVEPFNGAATGAGGEIRDRLAGGQGSIPLAGTAVYMTALSRLTSDRDWEKHVAERKWLYQAPVDILIKASNGASDFGNKFGQPLITGSLLTFEHEENAVTLGYDKVIMQAGGIGYAKASQATKLKPAVDDKVVILGGDNYRIGMGGAAVSSADTGVFDSAIELNAVQRSNPEMQKRVANVVRGLVESDHNTIISIHDHGAGGHLNCLSELVEETGGLIDLDKLPVGDPTLSAKEIIGNESQERMGIVIGQENIATMQRIAERERSPMYVVGQVTGDHRFTFKSATTGLKPMDLNMADMFGSSPKVYMRDKTVTRSYQPVTYNIQQLQQYLEQVLQLEAVASKDWLVNKVDRCVSGRVAKQQCAGPLQLPLNNCGVMALDFQGQHGIATSIGHAPLSALINPAAGSRNAIAEALSNIVWAPLKDGITSVSLSANWMWPCKNEGEDARLYEAVKACSDFAIALGINIPTGKDSLSMKQKYPDREVIAPGTVIISATGHCDDIKAVVEPVLRKEGGHIYYINLSGDTYKLGGSSFGQILNKIGDQTPDMVNAAAFRQAFDTLQQLIKAGSIQAGHDVGSGGLIVTLLELCFADRDLGAHIDLSGLGGQDIIEILFAENNGVVFQADASVEAALEKAGVTYHRIGTVTSTAALTVKHATGDWQFDIDHLRDVWSTTSYLLDQKQSGTVKAKERFDNYKHQPLKFTFPAGFTGKKPVIDSTRPRIKAAVLREKGSNSEREMANAMYMAGFDVKDVHMTDLISGRETLEDIQFLGAVGGFSNSDVLGSAKGWAGAFLYNPKAKEAIEKFFNREDTLSVGICNGCQLFVELGLINLDHGEKPRMLHNDSHKHESIFTSVTIQENKSVLLSNLAGSTLGVWVSHGEGKFDFPYEEDKYNIVGKYGYEGYPANPNGSGFNAAMLCDVTGRHLVMMPHIERSIFQWNWAHYPGGRKDEVTPWLQAFINAREWLQK
ncbi:phosphoribosylformylglycinamidine synthase [Chitinophaga sp.]|uniref:phosphoribosylformylglycinamidine synthase n=1 Tax=Chitinophaga sp. TaxID=1869181 RepID=UPI0031D6A6BF